MGVLLSILLIVLGMLGAETVVTEKAPPACKNFLAILRPYQESLGLAGLILGGVSLIEWIFRFPHLIRFAPSHALLSLATTLLLLALGLLFGLEPIRRNLKDTSVSWFATADRLKAKLLPLEKKISLAGLAVGIFYLLLIIL